MHSPIFNSIAIFGLPGGSEIIIVGVVILLLFGGKKIPELMRGLGRGVGELKTGLEEGKKGFQEATDNTAEEKARQTAESTK